MHARFIDFLHTNPSAFHAAHNVAQALTAQGFSLIDATSPAPADPAAPGGHVLVDGGAVIAWWVPEHPRPRFRIVGSHTDSPGLMAKPQPDFQREGLRQVAVEVYGGPILQTWLDRDLRFAGRVVTDDGAQHLVDTGAVARVPNLAIHLYRADAPTVERQAHTPPVLGGDRPLMELVGEAAGVDSQRIVSHELITADAQRGELLGDLLAAGRLDNLSSVWASLEALLAAKNAAQDILVLAAFNHEEVGSASTTGAGGPLLERVLTRIAREVGEPFDVFAESFQVSADAAHAVHPNYPEKHDPTHRPRLNGGPVLKINANQRYASDAVTEAEWLRACRAAEVPSQTFVGNNSVPCGSTIGPISSTRMGIRTVDVGVPLLSMHSARELCGARDMEYFVRALTAFYGARAE
ncbi:M18 family aminopeptidase [Corynebacterium gottingense]|uniref:M18 family aminopeptidase n=1 Tax=Corynebacterium gottingense TaxID=2041036 RepID=A0ABX9ULE1_9CORY|nr:M18 family aminopeptidase [Corynebacterium gottingense]RMD20272.1 M18 family aminopeptidase [Corynebacterium gottingense]WJZ13126.1 putative M18 family aminopeptidase 2 [Corynebacterium gottingense]WJZ15449.1 putative M18 family aminopeptidase 2 [Corynebacterium gottingense]